MKQYHDLLERVMNEGVEKMDRTGTGTVSVFGHQMRFDLREGFPLITTKKVHTKSIIHELLWFIAGDTNIEYLKSNGVSIWNEWAKEDGSIGPGYGHQWRSWPAKDGAVIDQLAEAQRLLRENPDSRRIIVSAWNPTDVPEMALPPCHMMFQFYSRPLAKKELIKRLRLAEMERREMNTEAQLGFVRKMMNLEHSELEVIAKSVGIHSRELSCQLYQRSADLFLGVPFNIASYALLTHMMAQTTGHAVGEFIHTIGDAHIYLNHFDQVQLQLSREFMPLPTLVLNSDVDDIFDFEFSDIQIQGYQSHPAIKAEVAV